MKTLWLGVGVLLVGVVLACFGYEWWLESDYRLPEEERQIYQQAQAAAARGDMDSWGLIMSKARPFTRDNMYDYPKSSWKTIDLILQVQEK